MAISWCSIMAIIVKMAIMAIMAHRGMAIIMVMTGVFLKYSINADHWPKRCLNICIKSKVMTKTRKLSILWPFPLYFEVRKD